MSTRSRPRLRVARYLPTGRRRLRAWRILRRLGSGVVAGVADNDPTSVASLTVIGALTVYRLAWLVVLVLPMLLVVQVLSARLGLVVEGSLEDAIRRYLGPGWALVAMLLVVGVNLVTLAADLEGGAAALGLLSARSWRWWIGPLAAGLGLLLALGNYRQIQRALRYTLLVFVAYVAAAILARPDWSAVLRHTLVPSLRPTRVDVQAALALLGTTLTSYVYVWETIEEKEERPGLGDLRFVELDAAAGIAAAVALFWFIVVGAGATLGVHGQDVATAADAASALRPVAGRFASDLFALGLLASALLAVPVLAATTGYVVAEALGWPGSIEERPGRGNWRFYGVVLGSLALGLLASLGGVPPIRFLFLASVVGGLGTPLLLAMLLVLAGSEEAMGRYRVAGPVAAVGWATVVVVSAASLAYVAALLA